MYMTKLQIDNKTITLSAISLELLFALEVFHRHHLLLIECILKSCGKLWTTTISLNDKQYIPLIIEVSLSESE